VDVQTLALRTASVPDALGCGGLNVPPRPLSGTLPVPASDAAKPGIPVTPRKATRIAPKGGRTISARKVAPRLLVDGRKQSHRAFNNNLTQPPDCQ